MKNLALRAYLTTLYMEPQRHYHTLAHVQYCLRELGQLREDERALITLSSMEDSAIEHAIWFHDSVYDPQAPHGKNESESADLAYTSLKENGWGDIAGLTASMILATGNHFGLNVKEEYSLATKYFLDIDLAILGAPYPLYEEYAENIRKEYSFVSKEVYVENRKRILESFLKKPQIFQTEYFHNKYEANARQNIQWEIRTVSCCT